jgi:hypothetical protein
MAVAVLMLAAGAMAAPGQVKDVKAATVVELTVTKWFSPHFPTSIGIVGGDFSGTFAGLLLERDVIAGGQIVLFKASYSVAAGANSFSVLGQGRQNNEIHTGVFNGEVTAGSLTGEQVHEEYTVVSCSQAPSGLCFVGTIRIM